MKNHRLGRWVPFCGKGSVWKRNALPFVFVTVGVIILCVFVPDIVLFLPRMMY